jgi:beta-xylosidase
MLPHGGGVTVFRDEAGKYYSTFYGDDPRSIFRDRPAIVPLEWTTDVMYAKPSGRILVRPRHVIVERGPWAAVKPLFDVNIRDVHAMCSPDGTYYYTGSVLDRPGELVVWKSADMKTWEEMKPLWTMENVYSDPKWPADSAAKPFASLSKVERGRAETFWGTEIHFFKNTFWIEFRFSGHNGKASGTGLLRSTTGKAEGPYESLGRITKTGPCSLFVDDDGSVYLIAGFGGLLKLKPDMSGVVSEDESRSLRLNEFPDGGVAGDDTGSRMVKIAGKYVLLTIDWGGTSTMHLSKPAGGRHYGTYDVDYSVADNITGPYSRPRIAIPHGGHGNIFRDKAGNWWASFFSNDSTSPLRTQPGLIPLRIPTEGGTLVIQPGD